MKHTKLFSNARKNAPLPLFTSTFTQTITPTESEDEISPKCAARPASFSVSRSHSDEKVRQAFWHDGDVEMATGSPLRRDTTSDLDMDTMMLSPKASPCTVLPNEQPPRSMTESSNGGRMPTPIYGHFQTSSDVPPVPHEGLPFQSKIDDDYEQHMRARRLPTPISEDEAMESFDIPDEDMMDAQSPRLRQPQRFPMPSSPAVKRSKPLFSMGYRADCDMCKNRVPGHYNHVSWS